MYYFLPKISERPVYSYRLSIVHFWALVFLYIWAGPHHLLYSSLPDWAQTLGMVFSIMLIAPSWGGMLNGLLTLQAAPGTRCAPIPILKIMVVAVSFYGMSTFEGPMMSIRAVNSPVPLHQLDHRPRPSAAHWAGIGMITFAILYWLVPRLWKRPELAYPRLAHDPLLAGHDRHRALHRLDVGGRPHRGAGVARRRCGGPAQVPKLRGHRPPAAPFYWLRLLGGLLYFVGVLMLAWNFIKTVRGPAAERRRPRWPTAH